MVFITYSITLTFIIYTDLDSELTIKQLTAGAAFAALVWPLTWLWVSPELFKLAISFIPPLQTKAKRMATKKR